MSAERGPAPTIARICVAVAALLLAFTAAPAAAQSGDARFAKLADEFVDHWLSRRPQTETRLGIHDHDDKLAIVTQVSLAEDVAWLNAFDARFRAVQRERLTFAHQADYDVLAAQIAQERFEHEVERPWEKDPSSYLGMTASAIQALTQRDFAPLCARLRSVSKRLSQVPEVLRAARINLKNPPKIATEVAISQFQGSLRLYREQLPAIAATCKDPRVQADLAEADSTAVRAVESFLVFLREDLLPRSTGDFALGKENYQRKLAVEEMEIEPVDSILARGWRAMEEGTRRMEAVSEKIAPGHGVRAALDSLERQIPSEEGLITTVSAQLDRIRAFLREKDLLTMPAREDLIVRETPVFRRSLSFASMESPGVWERRATEAYYNVTPVEPTWTAQQKRDHLGFFNRYASEIVSVHEALPGHYYQFLGLQRVPSRVRQIYGAGTTTEGWAHYCEQMVIEEGFEGGDPRFELAQQFLAMQRIGRLIAGISLHTQGMTYDQAVQLFEQRCYMTHINAEREARRGTLDPTYLVYTVGKWRILDLRDEVRRRLGDKFELKAFHDAFLKQGIAPLPVVRLGVLRELGIDAPAATR